MARWLPPPQLSEQFVFSASALLATASSGLALYVVNTLNPPQPLKDSLQVIEIGDVEGEADLSLLPFKGLGPDILDVGFLVRDGRGDPGEDALPILREDGQLNLESRIVSSRPGHIDAALRIVEQALHVGAPLGVDGDALAPSDVAHDRLPADGAAALGQVDHHFIQSPDLDRKSVV